MNADTLTKNFWFPHKPCVCSRQQSVRLGTKLTSEFLGTFILTHVICLSVNTFTIPPFAIGLSLTVLVYQFGHVSGAQFNPAVSLGVWIAGGQDFLTTGLYWGAQVAGSVASATIAAYVANDKSMFPSINVEQGDRQGIWTEFFFTFLLVSTVLNVAVTKNKDAFSSTAPLAIGFTLMVGAMAGGAFSGGAYNPAVVVGLNTGYEVYMMREGANFDGPDATSWVIVILMNFLGAFVAGGWFLWTERQTEAEFTTDPLLVEVMHK